MKAYFFSTTVVSGLLFLTACQHTGIDPIGVPHTPTDGSKTYQIGWRDGCETGMTVYGNDYIRLNYDLNIKPQKMADQEYRNAWVLGQRYCRFYISSWQMQGFVDKGFGRGLFSPYALPTGERMSDPGWFLEEDIYIFQGFDMPSWSLD